MLAGYSAGERNLQTAAVAVAVVVEAAAVAVLTLRAPQPLGQGVRTERVSLT